MIKHKRENIKQKKPKINRKKGFNSPNCMTTKQLHNGHRTVHNIIKVFYAFGPAKGTNIANHGQVCIAASGLPAGSDFSSAKKSVGNSALHTN